jgi:hypothetical protein
MRTFGWWIVLSSNFIMWMQFHFFVKKEDCSQE